MNGKSFIKKLLPGGSLEWKALSEVAEFKRGEQLKPIDLIPGPYPVVTASKTETGSHSEWNFGPVGLTITSHGAYAGHVNYWPTPIWLANNVFLLKTKSILIPKFLYYFLKSNELKIQGLAKGGGVPYFNARDVAPMLVPIPCPENPEKSLQIQAEIVRILDAFTELTTELTAELTARNKQYNHYRDQLLRFEEGEVEWKALGDLCSIGVGQAPVGNEPGEYAFVNAGTTPSGYVSAYNTEPNTITTPSRGQGGIGYVGYQTDRFWCGPLCYRIRSTSEMLSTRFLYHVMANATQDIVGLANMTGVPALNKKDLVGFPVPVPSSAEQARIVAILDKFDALTNSIAKGLPREIELRQKQYEHYRDLLLNFPKPEEVAA